MVGLLRHRHYNLLCRVRRVPCPVVFVFWLGPAEFGIPYSSGGRTSLPTCPRNIYSILTSP